MDSCVEELARSPLVNYVNDDSIPPPSLGNPSSLVYSGKKMVCKTMCTMCNNIYSNRSNLLRHLRTKHKISTDNMVAKRSKSRNKSRKSSNAETDYTEEDGAAGSEDDYYMPHLPLETEMVESDEPMHHFMGCLLDEHQVDEPRENAPEPLQPVETPESLQPVCYEGAEPVCEPTSTTTDAKSPRKMSRFTASGAASNPAELTRASALESTTEPTSTSNLPSSLPSTSNQDSDSDSSSASVAVSLAAVLEAALATTLPPTLPSQTVSATTAAAETTFAEGLAQGFVEGEDYDDVSSADEEDESDDQHKVYEGLPGDQTSGKTADLFTLDYFVKTQKSYIEYVKHNNWHEDIYELVALFTAPTPACDDNYSKLTYMYSKNVSGPGIEYCRLPNVELGKLLKLELQYVPRLEVVNYINAALMYFIQTFSTSLIITSLRMGRRIVTDAVYQATLPFIQDFKLTPHEMIMCTNYADPYVLAKGRIDFIIRRGMLALSKDSANGFGKLLHFLELHDDFKTLVRLYSLQFVKTLCCIVRDCDLNTISLADLKQLLAVESNRFKMKSFTKFNLHADDYDYEADQC